MRIVNDFSRALRILKLDLRAIETVALDTHAFLPGLLIPPLAAFIGSLPRGIISAAAAAIVTPISLFVLVALVFVFVKLFKGQGTYMSIWRPASHAFLINAIGLLGFVPVLGVIVTLLAGVYLLVLWVVIVRTTQRLSTGAALSVVLLAFLLPAFFLLTTLILIAGSPAISNSIYSL